MRAPEERDLERQEERSQEECVSPRVAGATGGGGCRVCGNHPPC